MSPSRPSRRAVLAGLAGLPTLLSCRTPALAVASDSPGSSLPIVPRGPGFHAGVNLAHLHRPGRGYGSAACRAQLEDLAGLGASHVALTPFGYVPGIDSTALRYGSSLDRTLTDQHVAAAAAHARQLGLAVVLKPHIWSNAFWSAGKSRQDMAPADGDWQAWFAAYTAFAEHYARLAEQVGASLYVVGLEYLQATEQNPGAWATVAEACRRHYGGALTYAANWWREIDAFSDWQAFDFVGVNAYYPLSRRADPDTPTLVSAWTPHLDGLEALSRRVGKPVLFTEAGLQAMRGAAAEPWAHGRDGPTDEALQARAYEALLAAAMPRPWFHGVYWWKWFTAPGGEHGDRYAPTGRLAEGVLRRWWAG